MILFFLIKKKKKKKRKMDIKSQGPSSLGRNRLIYSSVCEVTACGRARGTHRSPGAHGQDGALLLLLLLQPSTTKLN